MQTISRSRYRGDLRVVRISCLRFKHSFSILELITRISGHRSPDGIERECLGQNHLHRRCIAGYWSGYRGGFCEAGAKEFYLTARSEKALGETKTQVSDANQETQCEYMVCDVTDEEQVKASIKDCVAKFGGIDVVDSNAGYLNQWKKIGESDTTSWWKTWEVNLKRHLLPHPVYDVVSYRIGKEAFCQRIFRRPSILISSIGAQLVRPTASDYQTSKHAINRLCEFVNVDHGEDGVKCFAIHPGGVPTVLAKNMPKELHFNLVDQPDLAAGFAVWLCSGNAYWARGRYLSSNWDIDELAHSRPNHSGRFAG